LISETATYDIPCKKKKEWEISNFEIGKPLGSG
jgi:hypothetical protein